MVDMCNNNDDDADVDHEYRDSKVRAKSALQTFPPKSPHPSQWHDLIPRG